MLSMAFQRLSLGVHYAVQPAATIGSKIYHHRNKAWLQKLYTMFLTRLIFSFHNMLTKLFTSLTPTQSRKTKITLILGLEMNIHRRHPYHHLNQKPHQKPPLASAFSANAPRVVICMTFIRGFDIKMVPLSPINPIFFGIK